QNLAEVDDSGGAREVDGGEDVNRETGFVRAAWLSWLILLKLIIGAVYCRLVPERWSAFHEEALPPPTYPFQINWPLEGRGGYVVHWSRYSVTTIANIGDF